MSVRKTYNFDSYPPYSKAAALSGSDGADVIVATSGIDFAYGKSGNDTVLTAASTAARGKTS